MNFLFLKGNIGRPGAGACPVRGHSNVQGDRTMGISEGMGETFLNSLGASSGSSLPRGGLRHGEHRQGDARRPCPVLSGPRWQFSFRRTRYQTHGVRAEILRIDHAYFTKLNRSHLVTGRTALILPCLGRSEIDRQARIRKFASQELRSEPAIIAGIAKATLGKRLTVNWDDLTVNYAKIRDSIARVIPVFRKFQRADSRGLLSSATLCPPSQRIPKPAAQGEGHRA